MLIAQRTPFVFVQIPKKKGFSTKGVDFFLMPIIITVVIKIKTKVGTNEVLIKRI